MTSPCDSHWGHSSPVQDRMATKTQLIEMMGCPQWPGCLGNEYMDKLKWCIDDWWKEQHKKLSDRLTISESLIIAREWVKQNHLLLNWALLDLAVLDWSQTYLEKGQYQARNTDAQPTLIDVILIESRLYYLSPAQPFTRAVAPAGERLFLTKRIENTSGVNILQSKLGKL